MINFHIITAFSRAHNILPLLKMFALAGGDRKVKWHPVYHDPSHKDLFEGIELLRKFSILDVPIGDCCEIAPIHAIAWSDWDGCYWKSNYALDAIGVTNGDYYAFFCDDNTYDAGFFDRMRTITSSGPEVVLFSARRYGGCDGPHGVLVAAPENMRTCHIGLEQYFVRGSVMKRYRFENQSCADGAMAEKNLKKHQCLFVPDLFVNWNLLPK